MKLRTDNIKKSYKGRKVVKGVSVEVNQGEIVGLLGPNGAGKTTSFYMIVGLVRPNSGKVYLDDLEITRHAMYKRAQLGIGYLPQEVSVFRKLSVEDNIMTVLEMTDLSKAKRHEKLESLLNEFGLDHVRKNLGQSLSGGEKRRTEIARALAVDPKFILLDEPFAGVDPIAVEDIQKIVAQLKRRNIGVLITDHNVQETLSITDRTYLLFEGSILREGTAESLAADEMVRKVYLGANFELKKKNYDELGSDEGEIKAEAIKNPISTEVLKLKEQAEQLLLALNQSDKVNILSNISLLNVEIESLKKTFLTNALPNKCAEQLKKINFKSIEYYEPWIKSNFELYLMLLIPVYGWFRFYKSKKEMAKCVLEVEKLKSDLLVLDKDLKIVDL